MLLRRAEDRLCVDYLSIGAHDDLEQSPVSAARHGDGGQTPRSGTAGTPASVRASNAATNDGPLTARVRDRAALARPAPSIFLLSQFLQTVQHYTPLQAWLRTLPWTEGVIDIREARADDEDDPDDPKTESGDRTIALDALTIAILRTWCKRQAEERLAWGGAWTDTGLVFTREDGTALPPQWVSARFEALAYRSGLPPSASTTCGMVPPACAKPPGRTRKSSATCTVTTGQASPMTCTSTSFPMSSKRRPRREQPAYPDSGRCHPERTACAQLAHERTGTGRDSRASPDTCSAL